MRLVYMFFSVEEEQMTTRNCETSSADSICSLRLGSMLVVSTLFGMNQFLQKLFGDGKYK